MRAEEAAYAPAASMDMLIFVPAFYAFYSMQEIFFFSSEKGTSNSCSNL